VSFESKQTLEAPSPIPDASGIGLRGPHHGDFLDLKPRIGWVEVHSENYLAIGGTAFEALERVRADYPVSLHGVGLSLGSAEPVDVAHLSRIRELCTRIEPGLVSEHLSWSSIAGRHSNDLLPLPFTHEALDAVCANIDFVQSQLGRQILIENVSAYLRFAGAEFSEADFLVEAARRSGAGILLDINNIYVNSVNHRFDPAVYLRSVPAELVDEIHLAGHSRQSFDGFELLIDTHDAPVCKPVWDLYRQALVLYGPRPVLIEWDSQLPTLDFLLGEANLAQSLLRQSREHAA